MKAEIQTRHEGAVLIQERPISGDMEVGITVRRMRFGLQSDQYLPAVGFFANTEPLHKAITKKAFAISRKGLLSFGSPRRT
ncbi:MAG: hypothetical protein F8N36_11760 [Desulfovibrio sp.]|nr:hypothetical protein [Desulfovibrio sp.]